MLVRPDTDRKWKLHRSAPPRRDPSEEREHMSKVEDDPAASRFEMTSGGGTAFVEYRRAGGRIALLHTEVPDALSGQGVGSKLVRGVLDAVRAEGLKVVPRCEFVAGYIARHPEYRDLLADEG
jgi:predicted GNAT family acetyltransferase